MHREGDITTLVYDLGDCWCHRITLESIVSEDKSDGKVEVLAGEGACPPEDSNGFEGKGNGAYFQAIRSGKLNKRGRKLLSVCFALKYLCLKKFSVLSITAVKCLDLIRKVLCFPVVYHGELKLFFSRF